MTSRTILAAGAAIATLSFAAPAFADITIVAGNVPGPLDTILLDEDDDGTDNQLLGKSNQGWNVLIQGEEDIVATTGGQAWAVGSDGGLTFLRISVLGGTFTGAEIQINEPDDGTTGPPPTWDIVLRGFDQFGTEFTNSFNDINNNEWFNWVASNNQVISSIDFRTDGDVALGQLRIGGIAPIPEPATWAMMIIGFGGVGAMMRQRRNRLAFTG
jgi:hypothetical protein